MYPQVFFQSFQQHGLYYHPAPLGGITSFKPVSFYSYMKKAAIISWGNSDIKPGVLPSLVLLSLPYVGKFLDHKWDIFNILFHSREAFVCLTFHIFHIRVRQQCHSCVLVFYPDIPAILIPRCMMCYKGFIRSSWTLPLVPDPTRSVAWSSGFS